MAAAQAERARGGAATRGADDAGRYDLAREPKVGPAGIFSAVRSPLPLGDCFYPPPPLVTASMHRPLWGSPLWCTRAHPLARSSAPPW